MQEEFKAEEVRQGETRKGVRWVLLFGTAGAIVALIATVLIVTN